MTEISIRFCHEQSFIINFFCISCAFFVSLACVFFSFIGDKAIRCHDVPRINTSKCDRTQKHTRLINEVVRRCDRLCGGHCCCHFVYLTFGRRHRLPLLRFTPHESCNNQMSHSLSRHKSRNIFIENPSILCFVRRRRRLGLLLFGVLFSRCCCVRSKRKLFSRFDDDRGILSVDLIAFNFPTIHDLFEKFKQFSKLFIIY